MHMWRCSLGIGTLYGNITVKVVCFCLSCYNRARCMQICNEYLKRLLHCRPMPGRTTVIADFMVRDVEETVPERGDPGRFVPCNRGPDHQTETCCILQKQMHPAVDKKKIALLETSIFATQPYHIGCSSIPKDNLFFSFARLGSSKSVFLLKYSLYYDEDVGS
jgi:hypothetical protein